MWSAWFVSHNWLHAAFPLVVLLFLNLLSRHSFSKHVLINSSAWNGLDQKLYPDIRNALRQNQSSHDCIHSFFSFFFPITSECIFLDLFKNLQLSPEVLPVSEWAAASLLSQILQVLFFWSSTYKHSLNFSIQLLPFVSHA